jgi:hypothetical protein
MDLVTLTDHDTIEGAIELASLPGTFMSEEVTVELPGRRVLHIGTLDITERQHERISVLRKDAEAFFAYVAEERIPAVVNHLFSALTGDRETRDFAVALASGIRLIEGRNGMMNERTNQFAMRAGAEADLSPIGGSDAHTLASVASAYTEVPGARDKEEFLAGLRQGRVLPAGGQGSYAKLTRDVALVFAGAYKEGVRSFPRGRDALLRFGALVLVLPLLPLIPVFTAFIYGHERIFAEHHHHHFQELVGGVGRRPSSWANSPVQP